MAVGTSGSTAERDLPVVASALTLPALMCSVIVGMASNIISIWPPSTSVRAPALPRYGMCTMDTPAITLNSSPAMWYGVPGPDDAYDMPPGLALAALISSGSVLCGNAALATSTRSE